MPHRPSRAAVVTGASGVIAHAVAERLSRAGFAVVPVSRGEGDDLTSREGVQACVERLRAAAVSPDAIVGLAATPSRGDVQDLPDDRLHSAQFVKVWAHALLVEAFAPDMAERGWGRVVLAGGITGREPVDGYLVGAVVNAGVRALAKGLALRWGGRGITVNAVAPGPVASPRFEAVRETAAPGARNPFMQGPAGMPAGRYLTPEEIAGVIAFLCSDEGAGINGTEVLVDGAASLGI
jgi:3-oxoacyl-[acyl-carrier protein] reductase